MNWGNGIAIFLTVFVLFILGLIYMTTRSTFDLEAEDYYAQEIAYQGRIDALSAGAPFSEYVDVQDKGDHIRVALDEAMAKGFEKGKIFFYRANDSSLDRTYELIPKDGIAQFDMSEFVKGNYEVRINWEVDGVAHALVQKLLVS
jgi:hypothetical protein